MFLFSQIESQTHKPNFKYRPVVWNQEISVAQPISQSRSMINSLEASGYCNLNGVLLSDTKIILYSLEFYCRTFKIFNIQWSSTVGYANNLKTEWSSIVGHENIKKLLEFYRRLVLLSDILNNILKRSSCVFGVLLSLEFYCRLQINFLKLLKILGFYCRWSSSVFGVLR